jgi:hypothetical protein
METSEDNAAEAVEQGDAFKGGAKQMPVHRPCEVNVLDLLL